MAIEISTTIARSILYIAIILGSTLGVGSFLILFIRDSFSCIMGSLLIIIGIFSILVMAGVIVFVK